MTNTAGRSALGGGEIEPAGTVIEIEGGMEFVSNGFVWLACTPGDDATSYRAFTPERMNKRVWWVRGPDEAA